MQVVFVTGKRWGAEEKERLYQVGMLVHQEYCQESYQLVYARAFLRLLERWCSLPACSCRGWRSTV